MMTFLPVFVNTRGMEHGFILIPLLILIGMIIVVIRANTKKKNNNKTKNK